MLGAIIGDIIGSVYEGTGWKSKNFPLFSAAGRFTDDTVLTVATADALLNGRSYARAYRDFGRRYPNAGYGASFFEWIFADEARPYGSWGNGSAMRVSPIGWVTVSLDETMTEARRSAEVTHDHPEGVKGAQAVATAIFLARHGRSKTKIRDHLERTFGYDLRRQLDLIRPHYDFDVSCPGSVPEAIIAFLEAEDFKDAIRNAVSLGGDADTQACIAGAIAHAYYRDIPDDMARAVRSLLPADLLEILDTFSRSFEC